MLQELGSLLHKQYGHRENKHKNKRLLSGAER